MIKKVILLICLLMNNSIKAASGSFSDLFKNPYSTASATSNGASGSAIASLSESCKELKNALMPFTTLFNIQYQYGFHSHLLAIDAAKAAAGLPPIFSPWFDLAVPGVSGSQEEPLIMKMCNIVIQFDNLGVITGSLAAGQFLNNLSGGKFNDELTVVDKLNNAANSVYDFNNGQVRKGALTSAYNHKKLIEAASASKKYWEQKSGSEDPQGLETEAQRKQSLMKMAQLSYQKSTLEDAMNCPTPSDSTNYQSKYIKDIAPKESKINQLNSEIDYYYRMLLMMGKDMYNDKTKVESYNKKVNELVHRGVIFTTRQSVYKENNVKYTSQLDSSNKPIKKNEKISKIIYLYSSNSNVDLYEIFRKEYVAQWEKYISAQLIVSGSFGLFDGKKGRLEEKYRSYAEECSELRLSNSLPVQDKSDPRYFSELTKEQKNCRDKLKIRESEFKNIMESYVVKLNNAINERARNYTDIWNFEAENLGRVRIIKDPTNISEQQKLAENQMLGVQAQQVSCSTELTPAEMDNLDMKLENINNSLKQQWAESEVKTQVNENLEREFRFNQAKEAEKRNELMKQKTLNVKESGSGSSVNIRPDTSGSF